jgi:hypothetical protein
MALSGLERRLKPVEHLTRGDDGDALMGANGQQMLAIAGMRALGSGLA